MDLERTDLERTLMFSIGLWKDFERILNRS